MPFLFSGLADIQEVTRAIHGGSYLNTGFMYSAGNWWILKDSPWKPKQEVDNLCVAMTTDHLRRNSRRSCFNIKCGISTVGLRTSGHWLDYLWHEPKTESVDTLECTCFWLWQGQFWTSWHFINKYTQGNTVRLTGQKCHFARWRQQERPIMEIGMSAVTIELAIFITNFFTNEFKWGCYSRVFLKCTRMAIMPILASQTLLRGNKKIQWKVLPQWEQNPGLSWPLILSPF